MFEELLGTKVLIQVDAGNGLFSIVGQAEFTQSFNGSLIDISNKSHNDFITNLDGELSSDSVTLSGNIFYNNSESYRSLRELRLNGRKATYRILNIETLVPMGFFEGLISQLSDALGYSSAIASSISIDCKVIKLPIFEGELFPKFLGPNYGFAPFMAGSDLIPRIWVPDGGDEIEFAYMLGSAAKMRIHLTNQTVERPSNIIFRSAGFETEMNTDPLNINDSYEANNYATPEAWAYYNYLRDLSMIDGSVVIQIFEV